MRNGKDPRSAAWWTRKVLQCSSLLCTLTSFLKFKLKILSLRLKLNEHGCATSMQTCAQQQWSPHLFISCQGLLRARLHRAHHECQHLHVST